jgi:hypothetical protein
MGSNPSLTGLELTGYLMREPMNPRSAIGMCRLMSIGWS